MSKASHIVTFSLFFEEIEKTPYYYKARYERILKQRQADLDRHIAYIQALGRILNRIAVLILFGLVWGFVRLIWGLAYVVEKTYDFVAWSFLKAHNGFKQLKRSLLCLLLPKLLTALNLVNISDD